MERFLLENREKRSHSTFYPDSITKEGYDWGMTTGATEGIWLKHRFVVGDLAGLNARVNKVAAEYTTLRKRYPSMDIIKLFEEGPFVRPTTLVYYDLPGRVETIARETVLVQFPNGQRTALERDRGYGFRGIVVRTQEPWAMEKYALRELVRLRLYAMNSGKKFSKTDLTVDQPWKLVDAAERQLIDTLNVAWMEYQMVQTPEKLDAAIMVEKAVYERIADRLAWLAMMSRWEHMRRLPFPQTTEAIELWKHNRVASLRYDETEPWMIELEKEPESLVTALRMANLMIAGKARVQIWMNPMLHTLEHPTLPAFHHLLTYGPPYHTGVGLPNSVIDKRMRGDPLMGYNVTEPWDGILPTVPGWQVLQAASLSLPEPKLRVRTRPVKIETSVAERLEAAASADKPVLTWENLNQATCPILVMPNIFLKTDVYPLFEGGRKIQPIQEHNKVEGWVTQGIGHPNHKMSKIFEDAGAGFLSTPTEGRPMREGHVAEILEL